MSDHTTDLPSDVKLRMLNVGIESLSDRTDALMTLVALQETELVILWLVIGGLACAGMKCYTDLRSSVKELRDKDS